MRLFIAVPIPEELKARVGRIMGELKKSGADYKWVEPKNLHLTLCFLGETSEGNISAVERAMAGAASGQAAFEMVFQELGAFDSIERPRVLWIGLSRGEAPLREIARKLGQALYEAKLLPEKERTRAFQAHLTLGRMRGPRNIEKLRDLIKSMPPLEGMGCRAQRLVLFESRLSPKGPAYAAVREQTLAG